MTQDNSALIKKITEAVMAELQRRARTTPNLADTPAAIHAPMGVCTGDYSKFPELAGRADLLGTRPTALAGATGEYKVAAAPPRKVFTGMVTANRLGGAKGTVYLTPTARLTPLAQDVARERKLTIEVVADGQGSAANHWLCWMQGYCPTAARIIAELGGRRLPHGSTVGDLLPAIREVAGDIKARKATLAVLFVPAAAISVCFANRCRGLRAVVGACEQAVHEGVSLLGANVLVIEYPHHNFERMHAMTSLFINSSGRADPAIERQLAELAACD